MLRRISGLLGDGWAVLRAAPLLWAAVFLSTAVPSFSGSNQLRLLDCVLTPLRLILALVADAAIPFLVAQAHQGHSAGLPEVKQVVERAIPRLLGFYLIVAILVGPPALLLIFLLYGPEPVVPSVFAVLLAKHLALPAAGAISAMAIAAISLHRLNAIKAVVVAVLVTLNNLHIIVPLSFLVSLALSALTSGFAAIQAGPGAALHQLTVLFISPPVHASAWQEALWWVALALLMLPISTYRSSVWVLLYVSATGKVQYPWIRRIAPA
jgi:hypothetical protein